MNYDFEQLKGQVKLNFFVTDEEWNKELDKVYNRNKGKYAVPGFRKGHAPRKMIENMFGPSVFFDDAFNACFVNAYSSALDEHPEIYPVDEPEVNIDDFNEKGMKFNAVVTIKPEIELGQYKGLEIEQKEYPVLEEEINAELERARERLSRKVEIKDRPVQSGDIVTIDYSGSVDGVKFDGGSAEKQELVIGSNTFIPGFEEQIIGMNQAETKDLTVKFPEEYHAESLKGKDAVFQVVLHEIRIKELPALDDDFAKDASKFDSLAEYKADIEANLKREHDRRAEAENENSLIEAVTEQAKVDIPRCMIESQLNYIVEDFRNRLNYMYQGMKLEDYLKYTNSDLETFKKDKEDEAQRAVKTRLTLEKIIKTEQIEVTEADVEAKLQELADTAKKDLEEYKKELGGRQMDYVRNDVLITKTMDLLKSNNRFVKAETVKKPKETKSKPKKQDAAIKADQ